MIDENKKIFNALKVGDKLYTLVGEDLITARVIKAAPSPFGITLPIEVLCDNGEVNYLSPMQINSLYFCTPEDAINEKLKYLDADLTSLKTAVLEKKRQINKFINLRNKVKEKNKRTYRLKINKYEFDVTEKDLILDNGSCYQCITLTHNVYDPKLYMSKKVPTYMSKTQFKQLRKENKLIDVSEAFHRMYPGRYPGTTIWKFNFI